MKHKIHPDLDNLKTPLDDLKHLEDNPRVGDVDAVARSYDEFGQRKPIVATTDGTVIGGNHQLAAAKKLGWSHIAVIVTDDNELTAKAFALADNRTAELGSYDNDLLSEMLAAVSSDPKLLAATSFKEEDLLNLSYDPDGEEEKRNFVNEFGAPPFSVLDTRQGYWQDRKREWIKFGIKSELGREEDMIFGIQPRQYSKNPSEMTGTSVFDPVLTELMYKWFSSPGANILDPFAGGSVRGIVAGKLGRNYTGIDLAADQIAENKKQAKELLTDNIPNWVVGDSSEIEFLVDKNKYDMLFTCPPYYDLEVYSDDPNDLSNMSTEDFNKMYREIIMKSCSLLDDNRFAGIVVGEVRDKATSGYLDFIGTTVQAFRDAGLDYYNELILVNVPGSAPLRAGAYFDKGRKIAKTHQNVLIFVKGDYKKATEYCGKVVGVDLQNEVE